MRKMEITYQPIRDNLAPIAHFLHREEVRQLGMEELQGIIAYQGTIPVGVLLYQKTEDGLRMHRIFVSGGYRRLGIGTGMLEMLCKYADASGQELLFTFDGESIRDPFYRFLASTHAFYIERTTGFEAYLTKDEVAEVCALHARKSDQAVNFFELSRHLQGELIEQMRKDYPLIAWELQNDNGQYRKDLCYCVADKNVIQSVSLFKEERGVLEMKLLYSRPGKGIAAAKALMESIAVLAEAEAKPMYVSVVNEASMKILDQMCPHYRITKRFYLAYYIGKKQEGVS